MVVKLALFQRDVNRKDKKYNDSKDRWFSFRVARREVFIAGGRNYVLCNHATVGTLGGWNGIALQNGI